jgi:predicted oxidoreductase
MTVSQIELSVLSLELLHDGTVDQCLQRGIAPMAWSPLGGGRIFQDSDERTVRVRDALDVVGWELDGVPRDQVALAWVLTHPARIIPVLGSGKVERIRRAAQAKALRLSHAQWFAIWSASTGMPVP